MISDNLQLWYRGGRLCELNFHASESSTPRVEFYPATEEHRAFVCVSVGQVHLFLSPEQAGELMARLWLGLERGGVDPCKFFSEAGGNGREAVREPEAVTV